jgi:hypothetical protein
MQKQGWSSERLIQLNGALLLLVLVYIPASNAVQMLMDENLFFWMGSGPAWGWLMGCFGLVLTYVVATQLFFGFAQREYQNDQMVLYIARLFVTALAVMLVLQSYPIHEKAVGASALLLDECSFSDRSTSLQNQYLKLQMLRSEASCRSLRTVKQCDGFRANDYTEYIQWVEDRFMCTGLCTPPAGLIVPPPAEDDAEPEDPLDPYTTAAPVQLQPVAAMEPVDPAMLQKQNRTQQKAVHAPRRAAVLAQQMPNVGNALFSNYNYEYHCGHMVATDLKNKGTALSDMTFAQGVTLLVLVVVQSFGELIWDSRRPEPPKRTLSDAFAQP